ncbi:MAG: ABC transporter, partial [Bradyrhizobium sp.]
MSDAAVPASTTHPTLEADITAALGPRSIVLVGMMGAGKSTIGLAARAYARAGGRITGGSIRIGGMELRPSTAQQRRNIRGKSIAY